MTVARRLRRLRPLKARPLEEELRPIFARYGWALVTSIRTGGRIDSRRRRLDVEEEELVLRFKRAQRLEGE